VETLHEIQSTCLPPMVSSLVVIIPSSSAQSNGWYAKATCARCYQACTPSQEPATRSERGFRQSCTGIATPSWSTRRPLGRPSGPRFGYPASAAASSTNVDLNPVMNSPDDRFPPNWSSADYGLRYTCPALTALDLCDVMGGDAIDQALRTRASTLAQLYRALELTGGRKGNRTKRQLLLDSRAEPWSKAERLLH
jgi:hypothetical protein